MTSRRLIVHVFPAFTVGGSQSRLIKLLPHLLEADHAILALNGDYSAFGRLEHLPHVKRFDQDLKTPVSDSIPSIIRQLRALPADSLLVTYNWGTANWSIANVVARRKELHVEDGFGPEEQARRLWRRNFARRCLFGLRRIPVLVPSQTLRQIALGEWNIPAASLCYVPNGVEDTRETRGMLERAPGHSMDSDDRPVCVVGIVCALRPEKRVDRLLAALADKGSDQTIRLIVVGDGPLMPALKERAMALGIADRVDWRGWIDNPAKVYREFDIFALTSDTEQLPMTVLEAMCESLPVVATRVGDIAAVVCPENKTFITSLGDDARGISQSLHALSESPQKRREIGDLNRLKYLSDYTFQKMLDRWRALMLAGGPNSAACRNI